MWSGCVAGTAVREWNGVGGGEGGGEGERENDANTFVNQCLAVCIVNEALLLGTTCYAVVIAVCGDSCTVRKLKSC